MFNIKIFIIDNITCLHPNLSDTEHAAKFIIEFKTFMNNLGASVLLLGHSSKKQNNGGITLDRLIGSKQISNFIDACFCIGKIAGEESRVYVKQQSNKKGSSQVVKTVIVFSTSPLLGSIKCPCCGNNLSASISTKMRKKFGRTDIGYCVCSRKGCKYNSSTKKVHEAFEEEANKYVLSDKVSKLLKMQLNITFEYMNQENRE